MHHLEPRLFINPPSLYACACFGASLQVSFLATEGKAGKVLVYFLTCASVEFHSLVLQRLPQLKGLQVAALHGKLKQAARESTLSKFTSLPAGVLLCTDVAARGLDIPDVAWILQYDMPQVGGSECNCVVL